MHLVRSKQSIVTRQIRNNAGIELIVHFLVVETDSGIDVRVLSATPIAQPSQSQAKNSKATPLIAGPVAFSAPVDTISYIPKSRAVTFDDLGFFVSQPTRAPSFA